MRRGKAPKVRVRPIYPPAYAAPRKAPSRPATGKAERAAPMQRFYDAGSVRMVVKGVDVGGYHNDPRDPRFGLKLEGARIALENARKAASGNDA